MAVLSEADLASSIADVLATRTGEGEVWIFGYGSLIWNPAFLYDVQMVGRVHGWHRRFCLWTSLSRGCPERPGLILGLDRGGACHGIVYRIPAASTALELVVLWRREMADGAYTPRWITAETQNGCVRAIAFTSNRSHPRYAGKLDELEMARVIAHSAGKLGRCSEYLANTVAALERRGIADSKLRALHARVEAMVRESALGSARESNTLGS
jgi:cation transport protein ChaC